MLRHNLNNKIFWKYSGDYFRYDITTWNVILLYIVEKINLEEILFKFIEIIAISYKLMLKIVKKEVGKIFLRRSMFT